MADYVVFYSNVSKEVFDSWLRATSDNIATFAADGFLSVDSVRVLEGIGSNTDLAAVLLTNPTDLDVTAPIGTHEVDNAASPTDVTQRIDSGRTPDTDYDFDNPIP